MASHRKATPAAAAARLKKQRQQKRRRVIVSVLSIPCVLIIGIAGYYLSNLVKNDAAAGNQDRQEQTVTSPEVDTVGLPDPCLLIDKQYLSLQLEGSGQFDQGVRVKQTTYPGEARCTFTSDTGRVFTISVIKDEKKKAWDDLLRKHKSTATLITTSIENFEGEAWNLVDADQLLRRGNLTFWLQFDKDVRLDPHALMVTDTIGASIQGLIDRGEMDPPLSPELDVDNGH